VKPILIGLAGLALAGAARAEDTSAVAQFDRICLTPRAEFATAQSESAGWRFAEAKADTMAGVKVRESLMRRGEGSGSGLLLFAWIGAAKDGEKVQTCTVRVEEPDFKALRAALLSRIGVKPALSEPKRLVFHFSDHAGARTALKDGELNGAARAPDGLEILTLGLDDNGAVLDLVRIGG
jgi:hypothetical protein